MATGVTRLSDLIVPEIFTPYAQNRTKELSRLISSGALATSESLSAHLNGAGLTFNEPFFKDLDNDDENVSSDDPAVNSSPNKIGTGSEVQIRLSRNNSWSSMDLNKALTNEDPMGAIGTLVGGYWSRRLQRAFIATAKGVFADNDAAATAGEHIVGDLTENVSGTTFTEGVTNFGASQFIDATATMGDAASDLSLVMMHSVTYNTALKNNLIDFMVDSSNGAAVRIPTYLGKEVIVDDSMPNTGGVFETWIMGRGAFQFGQGSPAVPTETDRVASSGNGGGQDILHNRVEWAIHPVGHAYVGASPAKGGPSNASTTGNLAHAASWQRRFPERKQIAIARLITREY